MGNYFGHLFDYFIKKLKTIDRYIDIEANLSFAKLLTILI